MNLKPQHQMLSNNTEDHKRTSGGKEGSIQPKESPRGVIEDIPGRNTTKMEGATKAEKKKKKAEQNQKIKLLNQIIARSQQMIMEITGKTPKPSKTRTRKNVKTRPHRRNKKTERTYRIKQTEETREQNKTGKRQEEDKGGDQAQTEVENLEKQESQLDPQNNVINKGTESRPEDILAGKKFQNIPKNQNLILKFNTKQISIKNQQDIKQLSIKNQQETKKEVPKQEERKQPIDTKKGTQNKDLKRQTYLKRYIAVRCIQYAESSKDLRLAIQFKIWYEQKSRLTYHEAIAILTLNTLIHMKKECIEKAIHTMIHCEKQRERAIKRRKQIRTLQETIQPQQKENP